MPESVESSEFWDFPEVILFIVESQGLYALHLSWSAAWKDMGSHVFSTCCPLQKTDSQIQCDAFISCFCSFGPIPRRTWEPWLFCVLIPPIWRSHWSSQGYLPGSVTCHSTLLSLCLHEFPLPLYSTVSFKWPIDYKWCSTQLSTDIHLFLEDPIKAPLSLPSTTPSTYPVLCWNLIALHCKDHFPV